MLDINSSFTSYGKEKLGFYENVDLIRKWRKKYKFPEGVEELFDSLNHAGETSSYIDARIYYVAYVLSNEGYEVRIEECAD